MSHVTDPEFYTDPFGGNGILVTDRPDYRCWVMHDEEAGVWHKCEVQPVEAILEANRELYNVAETRWGDTALVASIPNVMYWNGDFAKAREGRDDAWIKRFLNSSDNQKLRTKRGHL